MRPKIVLIGIALLIISFLIDDMIFSFIDIIKNPILDYLLGAVTHFGSIVVVLIIMTTLFLWQQRKREWIPVLWLSFFVSSLFCILLKILIARTRPFDIILMGFFVDYSFPSLHATASFTAIPILDKEFPKFKWFWIIFASIVAFSRIYLKFHYLSDVLAGIILGYSVGALSMTIEKKYNIFKKWKI